MGQRSSHSGDQKPNLLRSLRLKRKTRNIPDNYKSIEEVQDALRKEGLESCNLIIGIDFTKSNGWNGRISFDGRCLHDICKGISNPYEEAIEVIANTLEAFDDDNKIPCYGFGDASTGDTDIFSFFPKERPAQGVQEVLLRYRELVASMSHENGLKLAGPTSFAPLIQRAIDIVVKEKFKYHILIIIADGQVNHSNVKKTVEAIIEASGFPLSIIMVGVGDGPWDMMQKFDDNLKGREFDNFQFVNFTEIISRVDLEPEKRNSLFSMMALMECPDQYNLVQKMEFDTSDRLPYCPKIEPLPPPDIPVNPTPIVSPSASFASSVHFDNGSIISRSNSIVEGAPVEGSMINAGLALDTHKCPISKRDMSDPVVAADGITYERSSIEDWMRKSHISYVTGAPLRNKELKPNITLREEIRERTMLNRK